MHISIYKEARIMYAKFNGFRKGASAWTDAKSKKGEGRKWMDS